MTNNINKTSTKATTGRDGHDFSLQKISESLTPIIQPWPDITHVLNVVKIPKLGGDDSVASGPYLYTVD